RLGFEAAQADVVLTPVHRAHPDEFVRFCYRIFCYRGSCERFKFAARWKISASRRSGESTPRRLDDARLRRLVEIGMHRQADDLSGETVADGKSGPAGRIVLVGGLAVQRDRVIDRRRDAVGLERRSE